MDTCTREDAHECVAHLLRENITRKKILMFDPREPALIAPDAQQAYERTS
jgi:hypothetical protein